MQKYDFSHFTTQFPNEDACLDFILQRRFPNADVRGRVKGRKAYIDRKGKFIYPLAGTIFERSSTPLTKWFFAIFLFSNSRNGVSAKELQRQVGVTYKTAWRMCSQIRSLMSQEKGQKLSGIVEADETYIGGNRRLDSWKKKKVPVVGLLQRDGRVIAKTLSDRSEFEIAPFVERHLELGSTLYTDSAPVYNTLKGFKRGRVVHTAKEFVRGEIHTNNIEGFWSHLKRSLKGTHSFVSRKHMQSYVDAAVFRWNYREDVFSALLGRV